MFTTKSVGDEYQPCTVTAKYHGIDRHLKEFRYSHDDGKRVDILRDMRHDVHYKIRECTLKRRDSVTDRTGLWL